MAEKKATEAAEKRAEEKGVDLTTVEGTGAEGQVTAADVEKAESRFLAYANPDLGSHVVTVYPDNDPTAPREFYRNPYLHPGGPAAQMVTEEEFSKFNFGTASGVMALARKGG